MSGYGEARPIGRMVPLQAPQERLPDAWCDHADCGCKLSRYRDAHERYCLTHKRLRGIKDAPPDPAGTSSDEQARKPVTRLSVEQKVQNKAYDYCACGRDLKRRNRKRCRRCYAESMQRPGTKWSIICGCGNSKGSGRISCRACFAKRRAA